MKFMGTWKISPGCHKPAAEAFLHGGGAPAPEGMEILGRWHAPGSSRGWVLMEGDVTAIAHHMAEWGNLLELDVTPVLEDEQAGAAMAKVYG